MTIDDIREEIGRRIIGLVDKRDSIVPGEDYTDPQLIDFAIEQLEDLERWITPDVTTTPVDPKPLGGGA